jgi:hypothetical protein
MLERLTRGLLSSAAALCLAGAPGLARADEPGGESVEVEAPEKQEPEELEPEEEEEEEELEVDYTRDGFYAQAQGVYALEDFDTFSVDDDAGFNVAFGWRGWRVFAGELEVEWINGFEGQGGDPDFRVYDVGLLARLYPLAWIFEPDSFANRFQPFVKAGPAWQWVERRGGGLPNRDVAAFAGRFGAGLDFYVTPKFVLTLGANYMLPTSDTEDFKYLSAGGGLQYRFDIE